MLCTPQVWLGQKGPRVLEVLRILALMLCICSGHRDYLNYGIPEEGESGMTTEEPRQQRGTGVEDQTTFIFIHVESSKYSLPCSPAEMYVPDRTYHWSRDGEGSQFLSVSAQGFLTFQHFRGGDSGNYSCTVSYQEDGHLRTETFHYTILGYHVTGGLEALLIFRSQVCEEGAKKRFLWLLQESLGQVVSKHHCRLLLSESTCFPTVQEPLDEFNLQVQFQVSPFGPKWDTPCTSQTQAVITDCYHSAIRSSLLQAKLSMTQFLKEHRHFPITGAGAPHIMFTNHFVNFLETGHCARGYGQTQQLPKCPDCCSFITRKVLVMAAIIIWPPLICSCLIFLCCWGYRRRHKQKTPQEASMQLGRSKKTVIPAARTPEGPNIARTRRIAIDSSRTKPPGAFARANGGDTSKAVYTATGPVITAVSQTIPPVTSAAARASLEDTSKTPYAALSPDGAVNSQSIPLATSSSARASLEDTSKAPYAAAVPQTVVPLAISEALEDTSKVPYSAAGASSADESQAIPLVTATNLEDTGGAISKPVSQGTSLEDLPPPPTPAEQPSNGEFVFPPPPDFSFPAGSGTNRNV
ncbi:hypothetical protein Y1Q_0018317 [Alligator mississippiensis]|uniref:Ig-like domain-containing protein n=1 Tax=Alligator mississippiensis TaxID=8496 RepID=A0A151PBM9_ALLMI|nr:hypothetical protein Y1Q_0018317 [Alligator mississippiensis]